MTLAGKGEKPKPYMFFSETVSVVAIVVVGGLLLGVYTTLDVCTQVSIPLEASKCLFWCSFLHVSWSHWLEFQVAPLKFYSSPLKKLRFGDYFPFGARPIFRGEVFVSSMECTLEWFQAPRAQRTTICLTGSHHSGSATKSFHWENWENIPYVCIFFVTAVDGGNPAPVDVEYPHFFTWCCTSQLVAGFQSSTGCVPFLGCFLHYL